MIKTKDETIIKDGIGVIVGRFQVSSLTQGHIDLFESVVNRHHKVICVLGLSPVKSTKNNPLDFKTREHMILDKFPDLECVYNMDHVKDEVWSKNLDDLISTHTPPSADVTLYGSRDSFIKHYSGRYNTNELVQENFSTGSEDRKIDSLKCRKTEEFRAGAIYATQNQYPTAFCAVDIAIVDFDNLRILLGRKPREDKFRLVGGFVDPDTDALNGSFLEINARRETREETGLVVETLEYVDSYLTNDWRYRNEENKLFTTLFIGTYTSGNPIPDDDICELKWVNLQSEKGVFPLRINKEEIVTGHHVLIDAVLNKINSSKLGG